jgi:hypothetical protein
MTSTPSASNAAKGSMRRVGSMPKSRNARSAARAAIKCTSREDFGTVVSTRSLALRSFARPPSLSLVVDFQELRKL